MPAVFQYLVELHDRNSRQEQQQSTPSVFATITASPAAGKPEAGEAPGFDTSSQQAQPLGVDLRPSKQRTGGKKKLTARMGEQCTIS